MQPRRPIPSLHSLRLRLAGTAWSLALAASLLLAALKTLGTEASATTLGNAKIQFASAIEGSRILATRDDFIKHLGPFDRAARVQTDAAVSEEVFLRFAATNAVEWSDAEKTALAASFARLNPALTRLAAPSPATIQFIKTTGREEGGQVYTRQTAIILNAGLVAPGKESELDQTVAHELFHVLSRNNPALRDRCYAAIGFHKCAEVPLPAALQARRITNPDAPVNTHFIRVQIGGRPFDAVPVIFSKSAQFDPKAPGGLFAYIQFQFLVTPEPDAASHAIPVLTEQNSKLVEPDQLSGFWEQIGKNTQYIIHPEEILADNFSLLVRGEKKVASPEILERLKAALKK